MTRLLALFVFLLSAAAAASAEPPRASAAAAQVAPRPLASALGAMRAGDWDRAAALALRDGQAAADVIEWHRLREGRGTAAEVMAFLERNPEWPGLDWLRRKSEPAFAEADAETVRAFFGSQRPQTGTGALLLAQALMEAGEVGAAQAEIVLAWRTLALSAAEQAVFLDRHGELLAPHHEARLDMALWNGWEQNATAMLPLVPGGVRALAEARLALAQDRAGVDTLVEAVPEALRDNAGLAYERFAWRLRRNRDQEAIALLLERSTAPEALGEPWAWGRARRSLAREAMRAGEFDKAYRIAASHYLVEGSDFADLEWLSGYLALRHLDRPKLALLHFQRFLESVATPISLGRGHYWIGRAHEAAGDAAAAQAAYAEGAAYQTSYYGLLAAERGGLPFDASLGGQAGPLEWRDAGFTRSSVFAAGILLLAADELTLGTRFLTHLAESQDATALAQLGAMLEELDQPHAAVMLGKRAADAGITVPGPYYPLHPMAQAEWPVPAELALSIARRESEFNPGVTSGAGAGGLMQLMPGTARDMAGRLGLAYDADRLLRDWDYNARLGTAYLAGLIERFDGNPVMVAAGYNAGPGRPLLWMELFGDPRGGEVDVVDWVETIPFDETRNYVMRVTESLPVYRARLGRDPHPVPFSEELAGRTLLARR